MKEEEIRQAASYAASLIGQPRKDYINGFPEEYRQEIQYVVDQIERWTDEAIDRQQLEGSCKYNGGFYYKI